MNDNLLYWEGKVTTCERAVWENIKSGDHVFIGTACAAPYELVHELEKQREERFVRDILFIHFLADNIYPMQDDLPTTHWRHKVFSFVGRKEQQIINQGMADRVEFIPVSLSQVPRLFETGEIPIDVALVQTTYPDEHGYVSLGISVDITKAAVENARTVIAQINPHVPWTRGDSFVPVDKIDYMVKVDRPLWSYPQPEIEEDVAERIGSYVAHRIEDGSTLQIGIGRYPAGVLKHLHSRKNLGIHSDVKDGELKSRIRPKLREGEGVTISRGDVNYVATEWGITNLFAKSIQERALRLIEITHPIFRDWLLSEAKELKYIREDYVLESKGAYPEGEERLQTLRSGESVLIRSAKGSDFGALRIFFYRTNPEDIHSRFHGPVSYLPESKYDFLVNVDYEKNIAFAAVVGGQEDGRIVSISNYVYDEDTDLVEFSHLTHQDWQGKGLCGRLRQRLIEYPQSKNERGFLEIITKVTQ